MGRRDACFGEGTGGLRLNTYSLLSEARREEKGDTERDCQGLCRWRLSDQSICMSLHRFTKMSKSYGGGVV